MATPRANVMRNQTLHMGEGWKQSMEYGSIEREIHVVSIRVVRAERPRLLRSAGAI
jgi:hypothetical protein